MSGGKLPEGPRSTAEEMVWNGPPTASEARTLKRSAGSLDAGGGSQRTAMSWASPTAATFPTVSEGSVRSTMAGGEAALKPPSPTDRTAKANRQLGGTGTVNVV